MTVLYLTVIITTIQMMTGSYIYWSPDGVQDLWCPYSSSCSSEPTQLGVDHCCACKSLPLWELPFSNISYQSLSVELFNVEMTRTKVFNTTAFSLNSTVFRFSHINGNLRLFPENSCDFNIVFIDVTNNLFSEIGNMSCFGNLDTLIMKGNLITYLSNETFKGMDKLRVVDLSYNQIRSMGLNVISNNRVLYFNFGSNKFSLVDVTNILTPNKTSCGVSFENNTRPIQITNTLNFQLGKDSSMVCNNVTFSGGGTTSQLLSLISDNIESKEIIKYVPCGIIEYKGTGLSCDCELAELIPLSFPDIQRIYSLPLNEYYCETPETLSNISLVDVHSNETLSDEMICDLHDYCHSTPTCHCTCISQPTRDRILVECSNQSCTNLPDVLPKSKYKIVLKINHNNIHNLKERKYFSRVKMLDISENPVVFIHEGIGNLKIATDIIVTNHSLKTLPKSIQNLHPDVFNFGLNGIPCNCENRWIGEWRLYKGASRPLYCSNYPKVLIEDIIGSLNNCNDDHTFPYWSIFLVLLLCLVILGLFGILRYFSFYFVLLRRRFSETKERNQWETDVFISFDDDNNDVRYYCFRSLEPFLRRHDITTYIPCRDQIPGYNQEDMVVESMSKCKYVLILQSDGMYDRPRSGFVKRMEYNRAWDYFVNLYIHKILILNFDTSEEKFLARKTRALNMFGLGFVISDRKKSLQEKLLKTFDEPLIVHSKHSKQRKRYIKVKLGPKNTPKLSY